MITIKELDKKFKQLEEESATWLSAWKDIKTYIAPNRGYFELDPNNGALTDNKKLIDNEAQKSLRILSAGMVSGLTSPSRPWFKLSLEDKELTELKEVKIWLEEVRTRMFAIFSKSNVYEILSGLYSEVAGFGHGASAFLADFDSVIRGTSFTCGEYHLGLDSKNRVTSFARKFSYKIGQLVDEFGEENLKDETRKCFERGELNKRVDVYNIIMPNPDRDENKQDDVNMAFSSFYWETKATKPLAKRGFRTFPVVAPRWEVIKTDDTYSRSCPGLEALGDSKMLQSLQRADLLARAKVNNPPIVVGTNVKHTNSLPGGVTRAGEVAPGKDSARPLYSISPDFNATADKIYITKRQIKECFFTDLFLMLTQASPRDRTAREVIELHEEKLLTLGPILTKLQSELLIPLIDRTFDIMIEVGLMPEPPEVIEGLDLKVEFISTLAQAQKMVGTTSIEQTLGFVGQVLAINPNAVDKFDCDEAIDQYSDMTGIHPSIIRDKEAVKKLRDDRAKLQQAQQQAESMGNIVQGSKALSETEMGKDSALDRIMDGVGRGKTE